MRIFSVQSQPSYTGKVYMNITNIDREISNYPVPVYELLWNNLHKLRYSLEQNTSDDQIFRIDFQAKEKTVGAHYPTAYYGTLRVASEAGKTIEKGFQLSNGTKQNNDSSTLPDTSAILQEGFNDVSNRCINGELNCTQQTLTDSDLYKSLDTEIQKLAYDIYNRIKPTAKTVMDRAAIACYIAESMTGYPKETIDAMIRYINWLTENFESNTERDRLFYLDAKYFNAEPKNEGGTFIYGFKKIGFSIGSFSMNNYHFSKQGQWVPNKIERYYSAIKTQTIPADGQSPICISDSNQICEELFKPLAAKILETYRKQTFI